MNHFERHIEEGTRAEKLAFLKNHYRYNTMNSWNRSSSYANIVKLHTLPIPKEYRDKAYELISMDAYEFWDDVHSLIADFREETGYTAGFNGSSGGYIVLYEAKKVLDEHKSFCPECGQRNFQVATEGHDKCGVCGAKRINYQKPLYRWDTYLRRSIDQDEDFEEWEDYAINRRVALVTRFDRLCDEILDTFLEYLANYEIEEETVLVEKKIKVLKKGA